MSYRVIIMYKINGKTAIPPSIFSILWVFVSGTGLQHFDSNNPFKHLGLEFLLPTSILVTQIWLHRRPLGTNLWPQTWCNIPAEAHCGQLSSHFAQSELRRVLFWNSRPPLFWLQALIFFFFFLRFSLKILKMAVKDKGKEEKVAFCHSLSIGIAFSKSKQRNK